MSLDKVKIKARFEDIQKAIDRLSEFTKIDKNSFLSNEDFIHIARSHLLIASEASINICYHIAAKRLKRAPAEYSSCFELLQRHKLISEELALHLIKLIGLRNRMVHRYEEIDYGFIYDNFKEIIENFRKLINEVSSLII
ncbi:MAG: DUF86 domain-containing protein [Nitrospirae bacterium]|nr:DUF86 domain-containing protein [Nitrospirota bacterium]